jgi:hypothetical protein
MDFNNECIGRLLFGCVVIMMEGASWAAFLGVCVRPIQK